MEDLRGSAHSVPLLQAGHDLFAGLVGCIDAIVETNSEERVAGQDQPGMSLELFVYCCKPIGMADDILGDGSLMTEDTDKIRFSADPHDLF